MANRADTVKTNVDRPGLEAFFRQSTMKFVLGFRHPMTVGDYCPMHAHASMEIVYHPTGAGVTKVENGAEVRFSDGSAVVYGPMVRHDQAIVKSGYDLCIHITTEQSVPAELSSCLYAAPIGGGSLATELEALSRLPSGLPRMQQMALNHRATAVMIQLLELSDAAGLDVRPPAERYAESAHDYIMSHFDQIDSMAGVAAQVGVSHDYLRHIFRERYGMSLARCLSLARVERSKDLLLRSALPLKTVARLSGFENERYYCHVFRKFERCTPREFRKR